MQVYTGGVSKVVEKRKKGKIEEEKDEEGLNEGRRGRGELMPGSASYLAYCTRSSKCLRVSLCVSVY